MHLTSLDGIGVLSIGVNSERAIGGLMADQNRLPGLWLIRNITWVSIVAAISFGGLMLVLEQPIALAFFLALAVALLTWVVGKSRLVKARLGTASGTGADAVGIGKITPEPAQANPPDLSFDLIETFPLPLILTGANEIVTAASATARRMFPVLSVGRPLSLALRNPDVLDALVATRMDGAARNIILDDNASLGQVMRVHVVAMAQPSSREPTIMCVFQDLTEQRATERMRVDFIANASHELRTPLASLLGFIETLQGPARDDPKARERFLAIMREQAGRMARLIDDLLSLSRAELRAHQLPTAVIDLRSIVREIIDSLSITASERGVALTASLPDEPMLLRGDRDDLLGLVENLVENGIRYGRDGKSVEIAVTANAGGDIALSVQDHGPGIPAEHIPRLTERFYRADISHSREIGGTGLGLAIVKHLVARHRARLEIESRIGDGATFRVLFPGADKGLE